MDFTLYSICVIFGYFTKYPINLLNCEKNPACICAFTINLILPLLFPPFNDLFFLFFLLNFNVFFRFNLNLFVFVTLL